MNHETVKFFLSLPDEEIELVVPKLRLKPRRYEPDTDLKQFPGSFDPLGWPAPPPDRGTDADGRPN